MLAAPREGRVQTSWIALALLLLAAGARAQSLDLPTIREGDSWTYQSTVEDRAGWRRTEAETVVVRASRDEIELSSKPVGSSMPPRDRLTGPDWSRIRSVDGRELVVNRPLSFPLRIGKSWVVEYSEDHPNRQHSSEHVRATYTVVGWQDVDVPGGHFHALKIEASGQWSAVMAPAASAFAASRVDPQGATAVTTTTRTIPSRATGRIYKAFWYVPAVKKWVKLVEEVYDPNGVRTVRDTDELLSCRLAP